MEMRHKPCLCLCLFIAAWSKQLQKAFLLRLGLQDLPEQEAQSVSPTAPLNNHHASTNSIPEYINPSVTQGNTEDFFHIPILGRQVKIISQASGRKLQAPYTSVICILGCVTLVVHVRASIAPFDPTCLDTNFVSLGRKKSIVVSVLTPPASNRIALTESSSLKPAEVSIGDYNDSWFDRIAINHLSQSVQAATGLRNSKSGYDGLVEAATAASMNFGPSKQRELVIQALDKAFPRPILSLIRTLLPQSKFAREYFAVFTTLFFAWQSKTKAQYQMSYLRLKTWFADHVEMEQGQF
uniref:Uncharacterized protein n=1 Tax=Cannabis sativa TaxID=3483 RepID=A0A803NQ82_CANSA